MKTHSAILAVFAFALTTTASSAQALQFTVRTNGLLPAANVHAIERAVQYQVNQQVAKDWPLTRVSFVADSPNVITFTSPRTVNRLARQYGGGRGATSGFHADVLAADGTTVYPIYIADANLEIMQLAFSHEVVETEVDPNLDGTEICDPVEDEYYVVDGVMVSDWVKPDGSPFGSYN